MWSVKYDKKAFDYINYIHNRVNKKNKFDLSNVPIRINHNQNLYTTPKNMTAFARQMMKFLIIIIGM